MSVVGNRRSPGAPDGGHSVFEDEAEETVSDPVPTAGSLLSSLPQSRRLLHHPKHAEATPGQRVPAQSIHAQEDRIGVRDM